MSLPALEPSTSPANITIHQLTRKMPQAVVTGASGVLGSAVYGAFERSGVFNVTGLTHSRKAPNMMQLDLLDESKVESLVADLGLGEGDWVIHCAAERRPDVAEKVSIIRGNCIDTDLTSVALEP